MGPYQAAFKTQDLIDKGVTHILNVSSKEYTKRSKYFKYLDIDVHDEVGENAAKFFRITNRFIEQGIKQGSILVHSVQGKSRAPTFILAYLIFREKMKLKDGLAVLREYVNEVEPNESFM
jgi:dual specificity phosphatase 12